MKLTKDDYDTAISALDYQVRVIREMPDTLSDADIVTAGRALALRNKLVELRDKPKKAAKSTA